MILSLFKKIWTEQLDGLKTTRWTSMFENLKRLDSKRKKIKFMSNLLQKILKFTQNIFDRSWIKPYNTIQLVRSK